jgi:hypothetical protein
LKAEREEIDEVDEVVDEVVDEELVADFLAEAEGAAVEGQEINLDI